MITKFENSTRPMRALQAWIILIGHAHNRQTLTYESLGELMDFPYFGLGPVLDYVNQYCKTNKLPALTVVVVSKDKGAPSSGIGNVDTISEQKKVFDYNWYGIMPPTLEQLSMFKPNAS